MPKKTLVKFLLAALAAAGLWACSNAGLPKADNLTTLTLSARADGPASPGTTPANPATKSSRDADGRFYWSPGDAVSLFRDGVEGNWQFTSINPEPATTADFRGQIPATMPDKGGDFWAIYPYSADNQFDGSTFTVSVPTSQTAREGSFADGEFVSFGHSEGLAMTFRHLCGGIKFTLQGAGITSVTLSGLDGEVLAGRVTVALDEQDIPYVQDILEPATSITLSCPGGFSPGKEYFFVTLPVEFQNGFRVEFGSGLKRTVSSALSVNRAKFQWSSSALDSKLDGYSYESFDIENEGVKKFIAEVDYSDDPDYTRSSAGRDGPYFASASDHPGFIYIPFYGGDADKILLSTSPLFTEVQELPGCSSPAKLYNLVPGVTYYYKILKADGSVLKQGAVRPKGQVRMIETFNSSSYSVYNMRDLGGWKAAGGKHIAYGKIYRGSELERISPNGKDLFLNTLGITADLDLRGTRTGEETLVPPLPELKYCQIPVIKCFNDGIGTTQKLYRKAIRQVIEWLSDGEVVYFHCMAGADRTGTLAFLIEALLGVSESDLSKDYELTTFTKSIDRLRNATAATSKYRLTDLVYYLRDERFGYPETQSINELVYNWATHQPAPGEVDDDPNSEDVPPLTPAEITILRTLLLVQD